MKKNKRVKHRSAVTSNVNTGKRTVTDAMESPASILSMSKMEYLRFRLADLQNRNRLLSTRELVNFEVDVEEEYNLAYFSEHLPVTIRKLESCHAYEDYRNVLSGSLMIFSAQRLNAYEKAVELLGYIPMRYHLRLLLDVVYPGYRIDMASFLEILGTILSMETEEDRQMREREMRELLGEHVKDDGMITVYRGYTDWSCCEDDAISYSLSEEKAKFFCYESMERPHGMIRKKVPVADVMWYCNDREEEEVMLIPPSVKRHIESGKTL